MHTVLGDTEVKMARKRKSSSTTTDKRLIAREVRDPAAIATRSLVHPPIVYKPLVSPLVYLEDRRTFHPDGPFRAAFSAPRSAARLVIKNAKRKNVFKSSHGKWQPSPPVAVGFERPGRVAICVRRKTRRQVIFASGHSGGGNRRGKRNYTSRFSCK